ncbi:hypothetical protein GE061_015374 [Apolygus lucorum]|uniref:SWIM-type domain-containing protein n=1 Tax=Apolygus lucorum TaxID=248454 RepID=A0A8S9XNK8_APOLU|nr:hypothetical protein GE061_015374 [Apolygus lucorum]
MALKVPFKMIKLNEKDIPGGILPNIEVSANSVVALRRFLTVRGLKVPLSVRKPELVELVTGVIKSNKPIDPSVDRGKWLTAKAVDNRRSCLNEAHSSNNLDAFPVAGWKSFPSILIPDQFHYGLIYKHIVETNEVEDDEESREFEETRHPVPSTAKPLRRGRQYFLDGHVQQLENAFSVQGHFCLRAKVQASMRKEKFSVIIKLHKFTAEVIDAGCHCKASSMGRCSHVSALLQALDDYVLLYGYTPPPCTSAVCQWNQGRQDKSSAPAFKRQYTNKRDPNRMIKSSPVEAASKGQKIKEKRTPGAAFDQL